MMSLEPPSTPDAEDELSLRELLEEKDAVIAELTQQVEALRVRDQKLAEIESSGGFRIVRTLWWIRMKLMPRGSRREAAFRTVCAQIGRGAGWVKRGLKHIVWRLLPISLRQFWLAFNHTVPFTDRSQMVLFASRENEARYPRRVSLDGKRVQSVKVSLITTVYNESANVVEWMTSLSKQTRLPDELVVVDAGSTDGTVSLLESILPSLSFPVKIITRPGCNIAAGRNIAIQNASHDIIGCTDFGCVLDLHWLDYLVRPFELDPDVDVSCGFYQLVEHSTRYAASFIPDLQLLKIEQFLPSSRSLAFHKERWVRAGGYPEWLTDAGEDTYFALQLKSDPGKWAFVPEAVSFWHGPATFKKFLKTVKRYSMGDGEAAILIEHYQRKMKRAGMLGVLLLLFLVDVILLVNLHPLSEWFVWVNIILAGLLVIFLMPFLVTFLKAVFLRQKASEIVARFLLPWVQLIGFIQGVKNRPRVMERQQQIFEKQLNEILTAHADAKGIIIYPPTHDWTFMFQRPQQMARAFARHGYLYFYCTNNDNTDHVSGIMQIEPNIYLCHVPQTVFRGIPSPILYVGAAWHCGWMDALDHPLVIYDHYDDLAVSSARQEDHDTLIEKADVVLVSSKVLLQKVLPLRPDALYLPNGVDVEFIRQVLSSRQRVPVDLRGILSQHQPIVGYSGALANWFDYDLLRSLALARPDYQFVLIGVDYDGSLAQSRILDLPNVNWLGMKPYQQLFNYVRHFDVAVIPFKVNEITLATSPIKLFEYAACQKPVVTTALPECKLYPQVLTSDSTEQYLRNLDLALSQKDDPALIHELDDLAGQNSWTNRVMMVIKAVNPGVA